MKIFQDRQVRIYAVFLILFTAVLGVSQLWSCFLQEKAFKEILYIQNGNITASLLEQGVGEHIIAQAVTNTQGSGEGLRLLGKIGVTDKTLSSFIPAVSDFNKTIRSYTLCMVLVLSSILLAGSYLFLFIRNQLYQKALDIIKRFTDGDFEARLPCTEEGLVYQLFLAVEQLAKALRAKSDAMENGKLFLKHTISDISHQLKTPLAALAMYNEIMAGEPDNREAVIEFTEKSGRSLERMTQLIASMLKITRMDAGSITFMKERHMASEIAEKALQELAARAQAEGKEIIWEGLDQEEILCDLQWTSEAVGNIVKNALDHIEKGGMVRICLERSPSMVRLLIADNGPGIDSVDLHHIFKRFYRSKNSQDKQGAGLGLSLAKSIIEGQGGLISVNSSKGEGTCFIISFLTEV